MDHCQEPYSSPKPCTTMEIESVVSPGEQEPCFSPNLVSELQAQGILRLRKGQVVESISCFHKSLKLLSRNENDKLVDSRLTSIMPIVENSESNVEMNFFQERFLFTVDLSEEKSSLSWNDDIFVQFRRALYLPPDSAFTLREDELFYHIMSGVLMYNIGLALHIEGLESCRSELLPNALHFYAMAHHTFTELCRGYVHVADSLNLALLAIVNNIAHINAHQRNINDALIFCNELSLRFSCMLSAIERGAPELPCEDYEVFVSNVCFGTEMNRYPAPAA